MWHKVFNQFLRFFLVISLAGMMGLSSPVMALDLQTAKAQGLVGEMQTGYLGAVKSSADVNALVSKVNNARKQHYKKIAKRNNTSLDVVEVLAGKKAIDKASRGHFIQSASGKMIKK